MTKTKNQEDHAAAGRRCREWSVLVPTLLSGGLLGDLESQPLPVFVM